MNSKSQRLAFPCGDPMKSLRRFMTFFAFPSKDSDRDFAKWYDPPGGRPMFLRWDNADFARAYVSIMRSEPAWYQEKNIPAQSRVYAICSWTPVGRVYEYQETRKLQMTSASNRILKVKIDHFTNRRTALHQTRHSAPRLPISGIGTTMAAIRAYVLAEEIPKSEDGAVCF